MFTQMAGTVSDMDPSVLLQGHDLFTYSLTVSQNYMISSLIYLFIGLFTYVSAYASIALKVSFMVFGTGIGEAVTGKIALMYKSSPVGL